MQRLWKRRLWTRATSGAARAERPRYTHPAQSDLHRLPQGYLGPRFSDKETLEARYTSQWSARPPIGHSVGQAPAQHPNASDPSYQPTDPRFGNSRSGDARVPNSRPVEPRPSRGQPTGQRSFDDHFFDRRYASSEEFTGTNQRDSMSRTEPPTPVQRVEMRYSAQAPISAASSPVTGRSATDGPFPLPTHQPVDDSAIARWQERWQRSALGQRIDAIVSQGRSGQKQSAPLKLPSVKLPSVKLTALKLPSFKLDTLSLGNLDLQRLGHDLAAGRFDQVAQQISWPGTVRVGLLSVIVFLLWWTWPTMPDLPSTNGNLARNALAPAIQSNIGVASNLQARTILVPTAAPIALADNSGSLPQSNQAVEPAVVSMVVNGETIDAAGLSALAGILVATATPARIDAAVVTISVPQIQLIPGVGINLPFGGPTPTFTPAPTPTPTPVPINLAPGRLWSTFAPAPESDHFWVGRPFGANAAQLSSPSYQFGSTAGERYRTHHGVDISNPFGTPVLAATDGEVVHAGPDDTVLLGPYNNFFGNAVVIRLDRKLSVAGGELDVFLLYGHLSQVTVAVGQRVRPEDVVGMVGMTGIAIGPHLHVEIRLGANSYFNNVNPYLWMTPLEGQGAVAVRVLSADGRTWPAARISLVRYFGGTAAWARQIETYMDVENIGPDPTWGENGAMEGVTAGSYYVIGVINGERVSAEIEVNAGRTTFVELRTQQ